MEKEKRIWNEPCIVPNPGPGPSMVEAIFYGNLGEVGGEWYCDVALIDDNISNPRIIRIRYDWVEFLDDKDDRKWHLVVDQKDKEIDLRNLGAFYEKIADIKNGDHKKIIVENTIFLS